MQVSDEKTEPVAAQARPGSTPPGMRRPIQGRLRRPDVPLHVVRPLGASSAGSTTATPSPTPAYPDHPGY